MNEPLPVYRLIPETLGADLTPDVQNNRCSEYNSCYRVLAFSCHGLVLQNKLVWRRGFAVCFLRRGLAWLNKWVIVFTDRMEYIGYFTAVDFKMTSSEGPLENTLLPLRWDSCLLVCLILLNVLEHLATVPHNGWLDFGWIFFFFS